MNTLKNVRANTSARYIDPAASKDGLKLLEALDSAIAQECLDKVAELLSNLEYDARLIDGAVGTVASLLRDGFDEYERAKTASDKTIKRLGVFMIVGSLLPILGMLEHFTEKQIEDIAKAKHEQFGLMEFLGKRKPGPI
jgi:hypothetical protein